MPDLDDSRLRLHQPYTHRKWRRLRRAQLLREPLCRFCKAQGKITPAIVCDHIEPHRGDINKFWTGKLQSLCVECHDTLKREQETQGWIDGCGVDGWPIDPNHPCYQR